MEPEKELPGLSFEEFLDEILGPVTDQPKETKQPEPGELPASSFEEFLDEIYGFKEGEKNEKTNQ